MSAQQFSYKAFISYSHSDRIWAEWLLKSLENFKVPKNLVGRETEAGVIPARLAPIFRDRDELPAAHRLTDRLFEALRASEYLIVLCSPRSAQSTLVNREIAEFKRTHGDGRVLCIIIDGVPFSGDPETECFPEAFLHSFRKDGGRMGLAAEGLAADVRPEGDGKRMALLKIVAGLIGVGLNDVARRDAQRRQRNMIAVLAASFIGMATMGALTWEATNARQEAVRAEQLAEKQRDQAEKQLTKNNALIHYMMTVIFDRLLEHGNLEALDQVTTKVLSSYEGLDLNTISPEQVFHYTGAYLRLGQNFDRRGDSEKAREIFEATLKVSRKFRARLPNDFQAAFRLQNNLFFTGYLALRQGRFDEAERDYRERLAILEDTVARQDEMSSTEINNFWREGLWQEKIADASMALATLLGGPQGQVEEALALHRTSIEIFERLMDLRATEEGRKQYKADLRVELASAYAYAGHTYLVMGQLDQAADMFEKRLSLLEDLLKEKPDNFRVLRRVMMSKQYLAKTLLQQGETARAHQFRLEATEGFGTLVARDHGNTMWLGDSAKSYIDLAETALRTGNIDLASEALEKGRTQIEVALSRDNSRPKRRLTLYRAGLLGAELAQMDGRAEDAAQILQTTLDALAGENDGFIRSLGNLQYFAEAHLFQSQLLALQGNEEGAAHHRKMVIDTLEQTRATVDLASKEVLAAAYRQAGKKDQAQIIEAQLSKSGYGFISRQRAQAGS